MEIYFDVIYIRSRQLNKKQNKKLKCLKLSNLFSLPVETDVQNSYEAFLSTLPAIQCLSDNFVSYFPWRLGNTCYLRFFR